MTNRRTPCVDGWCGPMLRTISSSVGFAKTISLIGALRLALLDGEEIDRVRPERGNAVVVVLLREVLSQGMAFPVVGQEHTPQVGVAFEDDAEEIVALALVVPGGLPEVRERLGRPLFPIEQDLRAEVVALPVRGEVVDDRDLFLLRVVHAGEVLEEPHVEMG